MSILEIESTQVIDPESIPEAVRVADAELSSVPVQGSDLAFIPVAVQVADSMPIQEPTQEDMFKQMKIEYLSHTKQAEADGLAGTSDFEKDGNYKVGDEYYGFRICLDDGTVFNGIGKSFHFASLHPPTEDDEYLWIKIHRSIIYDMYNIDIFNYTGNQLWEKRIADEICKFPSFEDMVKTQMCLPKPERLDPMLHAFYSVQQIIHELKSGRDENVDFYLKCRLISEEVVNHYFEEC